MKRSTTRIKYSLIFLLLVVVSVAITSRWQNGPQEAEPTKLRSQLGRTLAIKQDFFSCGGGSPSELSQWTLRGEFYVTDDRQVHKNEISALRDAILASRECPDILSEFRSEVTTSGITSNEIAKRYPWVKAPPPVFTVDRLTTEARNCLAAGQVNQSTSSVVTEVFLGGQPTMRLRLNRADEREGSHFTWGLPEWEVSVDHQTWKSRSPRIAQLLLPLMEDEDTFIDILQWPERFPKIRAAEIGSEWAAKEVESILRERIGQEFIITPEWPKRDYCIIRIASREPSPLSGMSVTFDLRESPTRDITEAVQAFAKAESFLVASPWLKSLATAGITTTIYQNEGNQSRWESANLKGKVAYSFYIVLEGDHLRVLTGKDDRRAIILDPNSALGRYITLPQNLDPTKDLIVSPDGTAKTIDKFGDLKFQF